MSSREHQLPQTVDAVCSSALPSVLSVSSVVQPSRSVVYHSQRTGGEGHSAIVLSSALGLRALRGIIPAGVIEVIDQGHRSMKEAETMEKDPFTRRVIGCAIEVHRELGPGKDRKSVV